MLMIMIIIVIIVQRVEVSVRATAVARGDERKYTSCNDSKSRNHNDSTIAQAACLMVWLGLPWRDLTSSQCQTHYTTNCIIHAATTSRIIASRVSLSLMNSCNVHMYVTLCIGVGDDHKTSKQKAIQGIRKWQEDETGELSIRNVRCCNLKNSCVSTKWYKICAQTVIKW